jgi:hypothetical protein
MKSTTIQASGAQLIAGAGILATAIMELDGVAQYMVIGFAGVGALGALWVMRERLRKWGEGDR